MRNILTLEFMNYFSASCVKHIETQQQSHTKYVKPFYKNRYKIKNIIILNPTNNVLAACFNTVSKKLPQTQAPKKNAP